MFLRFSWYTLWQRQFNLAMYFERVFFRWEIT
jgi:hypothetical protein